LCNDAVSPRATDPPFATPDRFSVGQAPASRYLSQVNCPACDQTLNESDPACSCCGFCLDQADATFGLPPRIVAPITDHDHHLSSAARRRLRTAIRAFVKRYPQVQLTLLLHDKPEGHQDKAYLFWLFNRSTTHTAMQTGGGNRQLLLWIQPTARLAALMPGYGLEPILSPEQHLTPCLQAGHSQLAKGQIANAALAIIDQLQQQLQNLATQLPTTFGWAPDELWQSMDDPQALLTLQPESRQLLHY
jgi:hypothetical protein